MIIIVKGRGDSRQAKVLNTMFEDRKRLFVDTLGWDVPVEGSHEIDAFDHDGAVYVIAVDRNGSHEGSLRLLPSSRSHLLDTHFAALCPSGVPTAMDTFEITRLCLPTRLGAAKRLSIRNALISAMVDHALLMGIKRLTGVVEDRFRKEILAMGWLAEPLGPALPMHGRLLGAFAIHIAPDTADRLCWTVIYQEPLVAAAQAGAAA